MPQSEKWHPVRTPLLDGRCNYVAGSYQAQAEFLISEAEMMVNQPIPPNSSLVRIIPCLNSKFRSRKIRGKFDRARRIRTMANRQQMLADYHKRQEKFYRGEKIL